MSTVAGRLFGRALIFAVPMNLGCSGERQTDPAVMTAQAKVREMLRDPESARFRNITRHGGVICGEVNSKNGFGGYAGFANFSYEVTTGKALVDGMDDIPLAYDTCALARAKEELREIKRRRA